MSSDLFLSILAMDAYNRGYDAKIDGLSDEAGTKIGNASIKLTELPAGSETASFYALAYKLDAAVGGIPAGTTIISYRGTDRVPQACKAKLGGTC